LAIAAASSTATVPITGYITKRLVASAAATSLLRRPASGPNGPGRGVPAVPSLLWLLRMTFAPSAWRFQPIRFPVDVAELRRMYRAPHLELRRPVV